MITFTNNAPALMYPFFNIRYPGITNADIGIFAASYFYVYGVLQPFVGVVVDKIMPRWTIFISCCFLVIGNLIIGLSRSLVAAYIARAIAGIGGASVYIALLKTSTVWFPETRFILLMNIFSAANSLHSFLTTIPLRALALYVNSHDNDSAFQAFFIGSCVFGVVIATPYFVIAKDVPLRSPKKAKSPSVELGETRKDVGQNATPASSSDVLLMSNNISVDPAVGCPENQSNNVSPKNVSAQESRIESESVGKHPTRYSFAKSMKLVFSTKASLQLLLLMFIYFISFGSTTLIQATLGITWISDVTGNTSIIPSLIQGMIFIMGIPGAFWQNFSASRIGRRYTQLVTFIINVLIYIFLALTSKYFKAMGAFWVLYILVGIFSASIIPIGYTVIKESFPVELAGTAIGVFNLAPFLGSAALQNIAPALMNTQVAQDDQYAVLAWFLAGINVIPIMLLFGTKETGTMPLKAKEQKLGA